MNYLAEVTHSGKPRQPHQPLYFNGFVPPDGATRGPECESLLARHDERRRIGRELHDATAQTLVALQMQIVDLKGLAVDPTLAHKLSDVEGTIKELHEEIRAVCFLSSMPIDEYGLLPSALRSMVGKFGDLTGLAIRFASRGSSAGLPVDLKISIYRIAQEALANIFRHAHADRVSVRLETNENQIRLVVRDNGVGVSPDQLETGSGVGLGNVSRRVRELQGTFALSPSAKGSRFVVTIPLNRQAA